MYNLTTRKIVLGLLMALVLTFSVQGIAEAFEGIKSGNSIALLPIPSSGDTSEQSFTFGIKFTQMEVDAEDAATANVFNDGKTSVSIIAISGMNPTSFTVSGLTDTDDNSANLTVNVDPSSTSTYTATVKYTLSSSSGLGEKNFVVDGTTVYTAYGVRRPSEVTAVRFSSTNAKIITVDPNPNSEFYLDRTISVTLMGTNNENAIVEFERIEGTGSLYEDLDDNRTRLDPGRSLVTRANGVVQSATASVRLRVGNGSSIIRATIRGANLAINGTTHDATYFYGGIRLVKVSGEPQAGTPNTQLAEPLVVEVRDWYPNPLSGTAIRDQEIAFFTAASIARVSGNVRLVSVPSNAPGIRPHSDNPDADNNANLLLAGDYPREPSDYPRTGIRVKSDTSGRAKVYGVLGTSGTSIFNAAIDTNNNNTFGSSGDHKVSFAGTIQDVETAVGSIEKAEGDGQTGVQRNLPAPNALVVIVRDGNGLLEQNKAVTFTTDSGHLLAPRPDDPGTLVITGTNTSRERTVNTDSTGRASVRYNVGNTLGQETVRATINNGAQHVIFGINGAPGTGDSSGQQQATNTITISPSSTTGEPGEEVTIRVASSPSGVFATLGSNDFGATRFSPQSDVTPFTSTLLLPVEEGTHSFFATGGVLTAGSATVTVEAGILGTISISQIGTPSNGAQSFSITVVDTDSARISGSLTVRVSGSGFTTRNVDTLNGIGNARLTLPTAASLYTLTASAEGYALGTTQVRIAGTGQQQVADEDEEEVEEEVTVAAEPDSIEITGPSTRSGTVNEELDTPLLVRVLDDDGDGLEGARVFYRVSSGRGRLSARGNGRAIGVVTDDDGYARASFTPLDGGTITVRANTDDLSATVTFTITTGSAPTPRGPGTGGTPGTSVSPVVHVAAASRPPMLWVDGGAIYALVGASPQRFAASVDNALNITVAGGKVYWTEKTGESGGTINSANLNGSGVTELASIFATPMGIAVDVTNSKLYWTNSAGRIQSANLDGSRITNVIPGGLETPMDLALAGGNAYWTQGGNVRFVNLRGTKQIRNISTGTDTAGSLVIGGGKVYWTEMTGESGGTVKSANLNGTGATQLASILAVPVGIAVDGSRSKLYWTNSRGRVQSANLDGSGIKNVVSGLGSPGELVLSNSIATPTAAATTTTTTTASNAKYDVNSDGSVDNTDAGLVADAMGTSNARYDVNGDGTVNFLDLLLVFDNRDAGAAGAPTVVGMKLSAAQIDIIEEQIDLLIATNDRSPSAMRVLVYLQQLLVTARPEKTQLLANYPNPFNPETWIPYELATDTNVRITIYNTQGVVIRSLQFGHQSAGYYVGRDRAAYWDGRNALGEQVASGLYFYQLETDEMSLMRKMVILK